MSQTREPRVLLDGLAYVESPPWHDGRWWFSHWGTEEIVAVDLDGGQVLIAGGAGARGRLAVTASNNARGFACGHAVRLARHSTSTASPVRPRGCSHVEDERKEV